MDTQEFFDLVLPAVGWRCLAIPYPNGGYKHMFFNDPAKMVRRVAQLDEKAITVYHAMAGFETTDSRTQANVIALRSFWLDVDVGDDPRKYPTFREAVYAVLRFAKELSLPQPYIVKSGRGAHVYWPLDADLDADTWRPIASMLKAASAHAGLKSDPSRTADHASILRPVGSTHRKAEPKPVELKLLGLVSQLDEIEGPLFAYLETHGAMPADDGFKITGNSVADMFGAASNDDLTAGVAYDPASADPIAESCNIVGMVRDLKGNVDQPTWYHTLGVLAFCDDGDEKAHEWSSGHPQYSEKETDAKLAQVRARQTGPTTCAKLGEHHPDQCALCPFSGGKIRSPITLGRIALAATPTPQSPTSGSMAQGQRMPLPRPYDIKVDGSRRWIIYQPAGTDNDKATWPEPVTVTRAEFYPISRIDNDGEAIVEFERVLPQNMGVRRFKLTGAAIGKGKDSWSGILGSQEIVPEGPQGSTLMDSLLKRWMHDLTETAAMVPSHLGFGWEGQDFVLGEQMMRAGKRPTRAIINGTANSFVDKLAPVGDLQSWVNLVDRAYNAPGQEGYQFLVVCGFAAPLLALTDELDGITVYAHSTASGVGKTTAALTALSIWGNPKELKLSDGKATANSLWATMGCFKSLPVLFDELTNMDPRKASELVFSVSDGASKLRLKADGELRNNNSRWRTIMLATGNNMLTEKLSAHRGNAEAEMSRLFEFNLRATDHLTPNEALALFPKLQANYGVAGPVFAQYVVDNYAAVKRRIEQVRIALNTVAKVGQKERFWSGLMACALVAGATAKSLGLVQFDMAALKTWMIDRLTENRTNRTASTSTPLEMLGDMLSELTPNILVTDGYGDLRMDKPARVWSSPRGAIVGRAALKPKNKALKPANDTLYIATRAIYAWAAEHGVSASEIVQAAITAGWASPTIEKINLGRGTLEYGTQTGYVACIKLYPDVVAGTAAGSAALKPLNVVGMPHGGGRQI